MRSSLNYANVMSTLAVFIALGGSSYAAVTVSGSSIMADRLGIEATEELKVRCPQDMFPAAGTCIDKAPRPPAAYGSAVIVCQGVDTPQGLGRRLPTHGEMQAALAAVTLSPGGELTSNVYPSSTYAGELDVLYVTDQTGGAALTVDRGGEGSKAFRCAADPIN